MASEVSIWESASGSAIARSLIEVLARKDIVTVEEVRAVLEEPLRSDGTKKAEAPQPTIGWRDAVGFVLRNDIDSKIRSAAVELVLTASLAMLSEAALLSLKKGIEDSLRGAEQASDPLMADVKGVIDEIMGSALSGRRSAP